MPPVTIPVGLGVSDVEAVDTTGSGRLDLVVTNKLSGQVSVIRNLGDGSFAAPVPYRAGTGLSAIDPGSTPEVTSLEATAGVAAGPLTPGGPTDLVTANPGSNTLGLLVGLGGGRFANPVNLLTAEPAQVVRVADFNHDGIPDIAVLGNDSVSVYLGNGQGGFSAPVVYNAGLDPTGLTVADLGHDGNLDLLIGNAYGDVLVLAGQGDGTFRPLLDLGKLRGPGRGRPYREWHQGHHLRQPEPRQRGRRLRWGSEDSGGRVLGPSGPRGGRGGRPQRRDGIPDLIVANSGGNNVLVYPGLRNGQFGPALNGGKGFFTGTDPVGVTVADLNGRPDLVVADRGSNDVTILLNQATADGGFTFVPGPRLNLKTAKQQGIGPVATAIVPSPSGGPSSLAVSLSGSNQVWLIPGVGGGFFNDQNPTIFSVGNQPGPLFVGNFDGKPDLVALNFRSNNVTVISDPMGSDPVTRTIPSGGLGPVAAIEFSPPGSGFDDLVVANYGDGIFALLEGGPDGLNLTPTEPEPGVPNPTDLAFLALTGGQVQFYAATAGREVATLVDLSLGGETQPPPMNNLAQLVPLQQSSLALVGTLLVTMIESPGAEVNLSPAETETTTALAFSLATPVGQGTPGQGGNDNAGGGGDEEAGKPEDAAANRAGPDASSWQTFVLGTDEALEQFQREHQGLSPGEWRSPIREAPRPRSSMRRGHPGPSGRRT